MRRPDIKITQHTEETTSREVTGSERDALLAKYYPELLKKEKGIDPETNKVIKNQPKEDEKRDGSGDLKKSEEEYMDIKYGSIDLDNEPYVDKINLKIEIRSNMKF